MARAKVAVSVAASFFEGKGEKKKEEKKKEKFSLSIYLVGIYVNTKHVLTMLNLICFTFKL